MGAEFCYACTLRSMLLAKKNIRGLPRTFAKLRRARRVSRARRVILRRNVTFGKGQLTGCLPLLATGSARHGRRHEDAGVAALASRSAERTLQLCKPRLSSV